MRNLITILFFISTVSFHLSAKGLSNCNELFTSPVVALENKALFHLKKNKINFKESTIEGHKVFIILPIGQHPLNKYASMLKEQFEHTFAVSPAITPKNDSALYAFDIETLFTSVKDITMNKVGAATRHETVHLQKAIAEQYDQLHILNHSVLKSLDKQEMFKSVDMTGYETFASLDEIKAYAAELHYSLNEMKSSHKLTKLEKTQTSEDIAEATTRLVAMVKNFESQIEKFKTSFEKLVISNDESYHYLKLNEVELTLPRISQDMKATSDLDALINELKEIESLISKEITIEVLSKLLQR